MQLCKGLHACPFVDDYRGYPSWHNERSDKAERCNVGRLSNGGHECGAQNREERVVEIGVRVGGACWGGRGGRAHFIIVILIIITI